MSMLSKDQIKQMIQYYDIKTTDDIKRTYTKFFTDPTATIITSF
ncbi:hypothetical protein [Enterococcus sp. DIV0086]